MKGIPTIARSLSVSAVGWGAERGVLAPGRGLGPGPGQAVLTLALLSGKGAEGSPLLRCGVELRPREGRVEAGEDGAEPAAVSGAGSGAERLKVTSAPARPSFGGWESSLVPGQSSFPGAPVGTCYLPFCLPETSSLFPARGGWAG